MPIPPAERAAFPVVNGEALRGRLQLVGPSEGVRWFLFGVIAFSSLRQPVTRSKADLTPSST